MVGAVHVVVVPSQLYCPTVAVGLEFSPLPTNDWLWIFGLFTFRIELPTFHLPPSFLLAQPQTLAILAPTNPLSSVDIQCHLTPSPSDLSSQRCDLPLLSASLIH